MEGKFRYYILREPGNVMVPLVPVDQLPLQLQGIPRQLGHRQMSEEGWKFVDEVWEPASVLSVLVSQQAMHFPPFQPSPSPLTSLKSLASDHHARGDVTHPPTDAAKRGGFHQLTKPVSDPQLCATDVARNVPRPAANTVSERLVPLTESIAAIYPQDTQRVRFTRLPPSGIERDPSKKVYCSHWIKTGECAFTAIGCKYKHEIPSIDKLRELGFIDVPKWFKEKSAMKSKDLTWMQRRANYKKEYGEKDTGAPAPRTFDPSELRSLRRELRATGPDMPEIEASYHHATPRKDNEEVRVGSPTKQVQSPIPDLLINVETPFPPTAGPSISDTSVPHSSLSILSSSTPSISVASAAPNFEAQQQKEKGKEQPYVRRLSQMSRSTDNDALKAFKQAPSARYTRRRTRSNHRHGLHHRLGPTKKGGLAKSEYAATKGETPPQQPPAISEQALQKCDMQHPSADRAGQFRQLKLGLEKAGRARGISRTSATNVASGTQISIL